MGQVPLVFSDLLFFYYFPETAFVRADTTEIFSSHDFDIRTYGCNTDTYKF